MVDITIVNGDYFMVYKPTNITGGPHPVQTGGHPFFPSYFDVQKREKRVSVSAHGFFPVVTLEIEVLAIYQATFDRDFPAGGMAPWPMRSRSADGMETS